MNCRHRDFQSRALPAELSRPAGPAGRPRPSASEKVPRGGHRRQTQPRQAPSRERREAGRRPSSSICRGHESRFEAARCAAPPLAPSAAQGHGWAPRGPCSPWPVRPWPVRPMTTATAGAAILAPFVHPATGTTDGSPTCATRDAGSHPASPPAVGAVTRCAQPDSSPRSGPDRRPGELRALGEGACSGWTCRAAASAPLTCPRRTRPRRISGSRCGNTCRGTPGGRVGAVRPPRGSDGGHAVRQRPGDDLGQCPGRRGSTLTGLSRARRARP